MINKKQTQFAQHLEHGSETQDFNKFIDETAPLIGYIIQSFNSLDQSLNLIIAELLNPRTDAIGLLVTHNLSFAQKVDMLDRLVSYIKSTRKIEVQNADFSKLLADLREASRLRNAVAHADWENTDYDGYTFVKVKLMKGELQQEYFQFTEEALDKIDDFIMDVEDKLYNYWDAFTDIVN